MSAIEAVWTAMMKVALPRLNQDHQADIQDDVQMMRSKNLERKPARPTSRRQTKEQMTA